MKENVMELSEIIYLARRLGIKRIKIVHLMVHSPELTDQSLFQNIELAQNIFSQTKMLGNKLNIEIFLPPLEEKEYFCYEPFTTIYINWNGDVRPCCACTINEKNSLKLGNLREQSLLELWNCKQMREIRKSLIFGRNLPEFCKSCSQRYLSQENLTRFLS